MVGLRLVQFLRLDYFDLVKLIKMVATPSKKGYLFSVHMTVEICSEWSKELRGGVTKKKPRKFGTMSKLGFNFIVGKLLVK